MAPTDVFDHAAAGCASMSCTSSVQDSRLLPTTRSPLHHGTEPDLSAHMPLPPGVASKGLDLSPVMGPASSMMPKMAKRKLRGSPAKGSREAAHRGSQQGLADRPSTDSSSLNGIRHMEPVQAKRVAAAASGNSRPPPSPNSSSGGNKCRMSGGIVGGRRVEASFPSCTSRDETEQPSGSSANLQPEGGSAGAGGGSLLLSPTLSEDRTSEEGPPSLAPLRSGHAPAAVSPSSPAAVSPSSPAASSGGRVSGGADRPQQQQEGKRRQVDINDIMVKARKAADNIRLLLHAKRCSGESCQEPGCESARQLVEHMRGCHLRKGEGCSPKCVQAQKMLRHYAECNRKRALGGRYCLVCSLVARSATTSNHQANSNVMAIPGVGTPTGSQRRQPLGHLSPGTASRTGPAAQQQQQQQQQRQRQGRMMMKAGEEAAAGRRSSVVAPRVRRGSGGGGSASLPQRHGLRVSFQQNKMAVSRDGKFFRPPPRTRRGSWGGYDGSGYLQRPRFDSIPEEVPEDCEDDFDETASEAGSKSTASESNPERAKPLVSSMSL